MQNTSSISKSLPGRSHGIKLIFVCCLVLLMAIPAMFISYISFERSGRATEVTNEVAKRYGGQQYITGPILVAPYYVANAKQEIEEAGDYVIFPEDGQAVISDVVTTIRKRSLFRVPTYQAQARLSASFSEIDKEKYDSQRTILWDQARIMVGVTDGRGLTEDIYLTLSGGERLKFEPAAYGGRTNLDMGGLSMHKNFQRYDGFSGRTNMTFLAVPAASIVSQTGPQTVKADVTLSGATTLGVLPYAKSTKLSMNADWPDPGFEGGFAPTERDITDTGFSARWSVPYLARGVLGEGTAHNLNLFDISRTSMTVRFVAQVNPYQTVNRALKYAVMFIGLVFIAYFLFEVLVGVRVHPAQYILIGLAQSIFYLLLLAFAEHIGFGAAFLMAAVATIAVTAGYAGAVFGARKYIWRAGAVFALTYGLLYTLMRMQDFALMIGALASFFAIALTMYLTRNMDWYAVGRGNEVHKPDSQ